MVGPRSGAVAGESWPGGGTQRRPCGSRRWSGVVPRRRRRAIGGTDSRHRFSHPAGDPSIVVGPCRVPPDADGPPEVRQWWSEFDQGLSDEDVIDRYDRFTAANTSGPATTFADVGGFDESLSSYGLEDYELAVRLLGRRCAHQGRPPGGGMASRSRVGSNARRPPARHRRERRRASSSDTRTRPTSCSPTNPCTPSRQLLRRLHVRRSGSLTMVVSRAALLARPAPVVAPGAPPDERSTSLGRPPTPPACRPSIATGDLLGAGAGCEQRTRSADGGHRAERSFRAILGGDRRATTSPSTR